MLLDTKMCNKIVDTYLSAIQFVPEWSKTQKISDKPIGTCSFVFGGVTNWYKTHNMCDRY